MKEKRTYTKYTTSTGLICGYALSEGGNPNCEHDYHIKIYSSMPRSYYYSALNEAGDYFDKHIMPTIHVAA